MNKITKQGLLALALAVFTMSTIACGGSGGSSGNNAAPTPTVHGVAAVGVPIVNGWVSVKGSNGVTLGPVLTNGMGQYSIDVSNLPGPYALYAEGMANGVSVEVYSVGLTAGNVNISPLTGLLLANAGGALPEDLYANWDAIQVTPAQIDLAQDNLKLQIAPVIAAYGMGTSVDFLTDVFVANGSGIDGILDALTITYDVAGTTATITNDLTGSTYDDNLNITNDATGLPAGDQTATNVVIADQTAINTYWDTIETLYATAYPTQATQLDTFFAPDYLDRGRSKNAEINGWLAQEYGPEIGFSMTATILGVYPSAYLKAYWVLHTYSAPGRTTTESMVWPYVYDGTNWMMYGNQEIIWIDVNTQHEKDIGQMGTNVWSGVCFHMEDTPYVASVIISAKVTGPAVGTITCVQNNPPDPQISCDPLGGSCIETLTDAQILSIPDNALYTIELFTSADASGVPVQTINYTLPRRPLTLAELNNSFFPTITAPTGHNIANANIPGILNVTWIPATNTQLFMHDWASLEWSDNLGNREEIELNLAAGQTNAQFNTTSTTITPTCASFWVEYSDAFDRDFETRWGFGPCW